METCDILRSVSSFQHDERKTNTNELLPGKQVLDSCEAEPWGSAGEPWRGILEEFNW